MENRRDSKQAEEKLKLECEKVIRGSGAKVTRSRVAVMRCLVASSTSQSPREILEAIENDKASKDVDQVSVYRILETFQKLGLVHQVYPSGGFIACTHVGCQSELHVLTHCSTCNKTAEIDIPKEIFHPTQWYLEKNYGFTYRNNLFQLDGICTNCSQAPNFEAEIPPNQIH